mgnify:CR=1 FL=1
MGGACSCKCCANTRKHYVLLSEGVLLETDRERTSGAYYFHPLRDEEVKDDQCSECSTSDHGSDDAFEVETEHRFAPLIKASSDYAVSIYPRLPEWRIIFENKEQSFCAWEKPGECRLATYKCEGVYAEELARSFWDPDDKNWDATIVSPIFLMLCRN